MKTRMVLGTSDGQVVVANLEMHRRKGSLGRMNGEVRRQLTKAGKRKKGSTYEKNKRRKKGEDTVSTHKQSWESESGAATKSSREEELESDHGSIGSLGSFRGSNAEENSDRSVDDEGEALLVSRRKGTEVEVELDRKGMEQEDMEGMEQEEEDEGEGAKSEDDWEALIQMQEEPLERIEDEIEGLFQVTSGMQTGQGIREEQRDSQQRESGENGIVRFGDIFEFQCELEKMYYPPDPQEPKWGMPTSVDNIKTIDWLEAEVGTHKIRDDEDVYTLQSFPQSWGQELQFQTQELIKRIEGKLPSLDDNRNRPKYIKVDRAYENVEWEKGEYDDLVINKGAFVERFPRLSCMLEIVMGGSTWKLYW